MTVVEDRVIAAIKNREAKMRSRAYFILQAVLLVVSVLVLFACVVFLASFIIYILSTNGGLLAVRSGVSGWYVFLKALPWSLLVIAVALITILSLLLRRYSFVYHYPLIYAFLGIIVFVALGGSIIAGTSLNAHLSQGYESPVYRYYGTQPIEGLYHGYVTQVGQNGFTITDADGMVSAIVLTPQTSFVGGDAVNMGDSVAIFGNRDSSGTIEAFGVEKLSQ